MYLFFQNVLLKGRRFNASVAVDRSHSHKLREDQINSNKEENDKRNLHLANYGLVRPGSFKSVFLKDFFFYNID